MDFHIFKICFPLMVYILQYHFSTAANSSSNKQVFFQTNTLFIHLLSACSYISKRHHFPICFAEGAKVGRGGYVFFLRTVNETHIFCFFSDTCTCVYITKQNVFLTQIP